VRSGGISLDTECRIPFTDYWLDFHVEKVVSTLKSQEQLLVNYSESPVLAGQGPDRRPSLLRAGILCWHSARKGIFFFSP
jgi:hypothetical protein